MKNIISLCILIILLSSCASIEKTRDELTDRAQVYGKDALDILSIAKNLDQKNSEIQNRSIAQIVFQKP